MNKDYIYQDLWDQYCSYYNIIASDDVHILYTKITILTRECLGLSWLINNFYQFFQNNGKLDSQAISLLNHSFQLKDNVISYYNALEEIGDHFFTLAVILRILPFLSNYGLSADALSSSIDVLGENQNA